MNQDKKLNVFNRENKDNLQDNDFRDDIIINEEKKEILIGEQITEATAKTVNYDLIDTISIDNIDAPFGSIEYELSVKMKEDSDLQLKLKREGLKSGLRGKELTKYIVENTPDISIREDLKDQGVYESGAVVYKEEKNTTVKPKQQKTNMTKKDETSVDVSKELKRLQKEEDDNSLYSKKMLEYLKHISEKQLDSPYALVSLPSGGGQYGLNKKIKMSYLNGSDEDLMTNDTIFRSDDFFNILFSRKILSDVSYKDLIQADRDYLLLWLRTSSYGSDYKMIITENKEDAKPFEVTIEIDKLPVKYLDLDVNENNNYEYTVGNNKIEFRFLTVGQIEYIQNYMIDLYNQEKDYEIELSTMYLKEMIVSINGETDKSIIDKKIKYMSIKDLRDFRNYLKTLDFGVDLMLNLTTPGGESVTMPFQVNEGFFRID